MLLKKHFNTSFKTTISGSSGLWKVIYLSLLSPISEKVKPYFPRKGMVLFEKLGNIVAFYRSH